MTGIKAFVAAVLLVCSMGCGFAPNVTISYGVPLEDEIQAFTVELCEEYHIEPAIVFAMMKYESSYDTKAVGDYGKAIGLMQVQSRWHYERMVRLGCNDLFDPRQNIIVAVDYLSECIALYDNVEMGLMHYNAGFKAQEWWFDQGIYTNEYSQKVLIEAQKLTEGAITDVLQ